MPKHYKSKSLSTASKLQDSRRSLDYWLSTPDRARRAERASSTIPRLLHIWLPTATDSLFEIDKFNWHLQIFYLSCICVNNATPTHSI